MSLNALPALADSTLEFAAILMTHDRADRPRSARAPGAGVDRIETAAHTAGHIAYLDRARAGEPITVGGDTLFPAASRNVFEGAARQMHSSVGGVAGSFARSMQHWKNQFR